MDQTPEQRPQPLNLTFNLDGILSPEDLARLPPEVAKQFSSPEFIERARQSIAMHQERERRAAEFKRAARIIRDQAAQQHELRRSSALSGRQRKRLRRHVRAAMKIERAKIQNESTTV